MPVAGLVRRARPAGVCSSGGPCLNAFFCSCAAEHALSELGAPVKTLGIESAKQPFEYPSVGYWSKEINGARTGGRKKIIFLFRDIDRPAMAAAPVESCQYVVLRSPWGRLGSVLYTCKRLHRTRGGFHRWIHIGKVLGSVRTCTMIPQSFGSRALWGAPSAGACGAGDSPTSDISRREFTSRSTSEKSK